MKFSHSSRRTALKSANCSRTIILPSSAIRNQSLAEARLPVGASTQEHFHPRAEEIYFITNGTGKIRIENETREVRAGDAIAIPPGQKHKLWNTGSETLHLLCCCAPAYEHSDTIITET